MTECFLIEPTGDVRVVARIFEGANGTGNGCSTHEAELILVDREPEETKVSESGHHSVTNGPEWDDIEWPTQCDACGRTFTEEAFQTMSRRRWWRRADTGEEKPDAHDFGPGAMWDAHWMPSTERTVDGRYLVAILPNGREWAIDGTAGNCTRPGEPHDCWPRHGDPPNLTVNKTPHPGRGTCSAGAGSIGSGKPSDPDYYHGFLKNGRFT